MKKIILLYNPKAGDTYFRFELDNFIRVFSNVGYDVNIYRSSAKGNMEDFFRDNNNRKYDAVFVAGGDGSVNEVVNGMMKYNIDVPLGIIPAGTANDLARYLNIPKDYEKCFEILSEFKTENIDVGKANDKFFVNICCGGLFTNVSQNIDIELKNTLGKLAYYYKGAEQLPNFKPIHLKITTSNETYDDMFFLFLILNSTGAGGFDKLSVDARINDGLLDFIGIKALSVVDMPRLFMKVLRGDHLNDKNIIFFRDNSFKIESTDIKAEFRETDIDGEKGPEIPVSIAIVPRALTVITNRRINKDEKQTNKETNKDKE